jgi:hypothetical protein
MTGMTAEETAGYIRHNAAPAVMRRRGRTA